MKRLLIVNPNASKAVTHWLAEEARRVVGDAFEIVAVNANSGLAALETPEDIEFAGNAVVRAIDAQARAGGFVGAIIAAFGDPGLEAARALGLTRVVGLGEMGIRAAGQSGRRFSIVTLGAAAMREQIKARAAALGFGAQLAQVHMLPFSIPQMIADREAVRSQIVVAARSCAGAAVLLGGAPFAGTAQGISQEAGKLVIDGVEAGIRALIAD
jgi:allantoin racemase